MEATTIPISPIRQNPGTGGFLDPDRIAEEFQIIEGMKIADFGSGSGYFTILMALKTGSSGKVYALDILKDKLDGVVAKARSSGIENIEPIRTDLEILGSSGLTAGSLDIVLLANILFQSHKHSNIVEEGVRVLKKGGRMIIIDWQKGTGGFGPPDNIRVSQPEIKAVAEKLGLSFASQFDSGQFHFGLIFKK